LLFTWSSFDQAVRQVAMRHPPDGFDLPASDDDAGSTVDIDAIFQRKLAGLRYLPRSARSAAYRAARDERDLALRGVRERQSAKRHVRKLLVQQQAPAPSN
jgi:hypothetical protein